ncbi:hypothetical protein HDU77_011469 [Chytriomyces hyalinus]|nr:hypothetical protein HDU77_011469 [Chytriomyces hyalinus]
MDDCLFNDGILALNAANPMPPPPPARLSRAEHMRAMVATLVPPNPNSNSSTTDSCPAKRLREEAMPTAMARSRYP